ncbi:MAG: hypothetical protein L0226_07465, partial [Acidobacteria bacterium]|nr:hypothetical protein [Acidobacteriota bacterium]
ILISLVTALALYFPIASLQQESAQPKALEQETAPATQSMALSGPNPAATPSPGNPGKEGAAKLLCDFIGPKNPTQEKNRDEGNYCSLSEATLAEYQVEHLIATIADPKDSRLDYLFDRSLDAIQRAIEATGYVLDRHFLPWEKQSGSQSPSITLPRPPFTLSMTTPSTRHRSDYTREPGIVLFRRIKGEERNLLLLFLVGETPTTGIHKTAFNNAFEQIKMLSGIRTVRQPDAGELKIRVLGPTFSGSSISLALSIRSWFEQLNKTKPKVQIISGSATAIDKHDFMSQFGDCDNIPNITFNATVPLDNQARRAFIDYLIQRGAVEEKPNRPQVAILTEANTAYGRQSNPYVAKKDAPEPAGTSLSCLPEREAPQKNKIDILTLTFPLHISTLRSEVAKVKPSKNDITGGALSASQTTLPMGEGGGDVIPLYSPLETASAEQVLANIFSAINRDPIRYIGLTTTDVQDRIFMTRELRRNCPNAVIFTLSADLLYLHSEANLDFQGMLVITPYPLFSLNQLWTHPFLGDKKRMQFPTPASQGIYNATLALLDRTDEMIEYGRPFDPNPESRFHRPVFWLNVVGRNGIWPVKILGHADQDKLLPDELSDPTEKAREGLAHKSYTYPVLPKTKTTIHVGDRNHSSLSTSVLLFISLLCLFPPAVLLLHLTRDRLNRKSDKWPIRKKIHRWFYFFKLTNYIGKWLNSLKLLNRNRIGRLFSVDNRYCFDFDRRVYLFSCCVSLLIISLGCTAVTLLPGTINLPVDLKWEHGLLFVMGANAVFSLTLVILLLVLVWLIFSIVDWMWQPQVGQWSITLVIFTLLINLSMLALACRVFVEIAARSRDDKTAVEALFFFLRATDFRSGVSLLLPWIFAGLAFFLSIFSAVRRLDLAEKMYSLKDPREKSSHSDYYLNFTGSSFSGLESLEEKVKGLVIGRIFSVPGTFLMIIIILVPYFNRFVEHHIPSVEGEWVDWFFMAAFYIIPLLLGWAFLRFYWLSLALRQLLRRLGWHPLFNAPIDTKDASFQMLPKVNLMSPNPTYNAMSASVTHAKEFFRLLDDATMKKGVSVSPYQIQRNIMIKVEEAEKKLQEAIQAESEGRWRDALQPRRETQQAISAASKEIADWMEPHWAELIDENAEDQALIKKGRIFMIGHVASLLQYILVHLQNLAGLVTIGLILILVAATTYPFQPREPLLLFSWVSILVVAALTLFIFFQINRDKVLSLLSGTTPGALSLSGDLIYRVMVHGVIPIIALLGAQFPEALRKLMSWLNIFQGNGN